MTAPAKNIAADLDNLLKRASAKKPEIVKKAEDSALPEGAEVGTTKPATTGAQAASMKAEEQKTYTAAAVDNGAMANQPNASVTNSPQGAAAASTTGEKGADAPGEMGSTVSKTTVNGDVMGAPAPNDTSGAFKSAQAKALAKMASDLDALADASLDPLIRHFAKCARASTNPEVRKVADGMDDQDLGHAASGNLAGQVENQQMSDQEAAQILQEAVASGAISEQELAAAVAELQGQGGAAGGDAGAAAPAGADADGASAPTGDAAGMPAAGDVPPVPAAPGAMGAMDPQAQPDAPKMAAELDPKNPDYVAKVAAAHPTEVAAGYKFAELLFGQTKTATAKHEPMLHAESEDEKHALHTVQKELGIDDSQLKALNDAPAKPMDKHAALAAQYRTQILNKIASLG